METNCRRKNSSSGDKFSFPVIIQDADQFEFGSIASPASPNSPADHLFSNGKLLPHAFPIQTSPYSRSTSRTSSKDSWISSRSNSTNSRSSACSSARTSTSETSERRMSTGRRERSVRPALSYQYQYQYGSSRRWQLVAAAPVLKHQGSGPSWKIDRKGSVKSRGGDEECRDEKSWFGKKFFKSFVSTCKQCHAIKT